MNVKIEQPDGTVESYWGVKDMMPAIDTDWMLFVDAREDAICVDGELTGVVDRAVYNQEGLDMVLEEQLQLDKYDVSVCEWTPTPLASVSEHVTEDD